MTDSEILNSAPSGATHVASYDDGELYWLKCGEHGYYATHKGEWSRLSGIGSTPVRSLDDIRRIVELENILKEMSDEYESDIQHKFNGLIDVPHERPCTRLDYMADMQIIDEARELLGGDKNE